MRTRVHTTSARTAARLFSELRRTWGGWGTRLLCLGVEPREGRHTGVAGSVVQLLLDAEKLVVLGHAVGAGRSAGLDLATVGRHGQVGDRGVLGLTRTVAHHATEARAVGHGHR